jgi:hypothetical protein
MPLWEEKKYNILLLCFTLYFNPYATGTSDQAFDTSIEPGHTIHPFTDFLNFYILILKSLKLQMDCSKSNAGFSITQNQHDMIYPM